MTFQTSPTSQIILSVLSLKGIAGGFIKKNLSQLQNYSSPQFLDSGEYLKDLLKSLGRQYPIQDLENSVQNTTAIFQQCEKYGINLVSIADHEYPQQLLLLKTPPPILFYIGNYHLIRKAVTIIGTRKPNKKGSIIAERVGEYFSSHGWSICNGLADGIDSDSIKSQEQYFEDTIGILGSGLSPFAISKLSKQSRINIDNVLKKNGLIISEIEPLKKQDTFSVIKSCRIQAAIGSGLILIQSSAKGGSRFATKTAIEIDKPVGVVYPIKEDINDESYSANKILIDKNHQQIKDFLGIKPQVKINPKITILQSKASYPEYEALISEW